MPESQWENMIKKNIIIFPSKNSNFGFALKNDLFMRISLDGTGTFGVQSRLDWYNLYVYCTACSSWLDVGLVLEMDRT